MAEPTPAERRETFKGVLFGLAAFGTWGLFPIYWVSLIAIPPVEVTAIRILLTALFGLLLMAWWRRWKELGPLFRSPRILAILFVTGMLNGVNWLIFVIAVHDGDVLQVSLGYYMNPLVNVALGFLVLGERLRPLQWLAVILACLGVLNQSIMVGSVPFAALGIALSFGAYGLLRKMLGVGAVPGMAVEMTVIAPVCLVALAVIGIGGPLASQGVDWTILALLACAGLVSGLPLIWFNEAARRMPYSSVGIMQYIAPSMHFLFAIFLFRQGFVPAQILTFALIWTALALYTVDLLRTYRRRNSAARTS